jgi:hypothetical protein
VGTVLLEIKAEMPKTAVRIFLFGLIGPGKNYVDRILEQEFDFTSYNGDRDLTPGHAGRNRQTASLSVRWSPSQRSRFPCEILPWPRSNSHVSATKS